MTILPKKKQPKDKTDSENSDRSNSPSSVESGAGRGSHVRVRTSSPGPQRWASPPPGDHTTQDRFDESSTSHGVVVSNKRRIRDRSSPHRSVRKQRHDNRLLQQTSAGQPNQARSSSIRSPLLMQQQQQKQQVAAEKEDEERAAGFNSEDECYQKEDATLAEKEKEFEMMLVEKKGFLIKKMAEDGACLFRAVADQVFGDQEMHSIVRKNCVDYMAKNVDFFKQFVTEDFSEYLKRKRTESCHGNHIEMQALCELYNRPIEVYQLSLEPINTFHAAYETDNDPIRLSYHRNVHYNSVINPYKATIGVGLGLPDHHPGMADRIQVRDAVRESEDSHIEQTMLEDKLRETDWELTQDTIEEQVARESYLQWIREQEQMATTKSSSRSATCSSSDLCSNNKQQLYNNSNKQQQYSSNNKQQQHCNNNHRKHNKSTSTTTSTSNSIIESSNATTNNNNNNNTNNSNNKDFVTLKPLEQIPSPKSPLNQCSSSSSLPSGPDEAGAAGFDDTKSLMNQLPPHLFGLSDWFSGDDDDDDLMAQALAESQQQYFVELKRKANMSKSSQSTSQSSSSSPPPSSSSSSSSASKGKSLMFKTYNKN